MTKWTENRTDYVFSPNYLLRILIPYGSEKKPGMMFLLDKSCSLEMFILAFRRYWVKRLRFKVGKKKESSQISCFDTF